MTALNHKQEEPGVSSPVRFDGFMSYSHEADDLLAPRLQSSLQTFAKPWWRRRALRVFRDQASLSANPHLWSSISAALDASEWFIVLGSPEAAASPWVEREVAYWLQHRDSSRILPVLTSGALIWDETKGQLDSSSAVPPSLLTAFSEEPRWVDLSWVEDETQLDMRNARFRDSVADIASALRGVSKDDLESEEVRQHRRTRRTVWAAGTLLALLSAAAVLGAVVSIDQRNEAQVQRAAAEAETARAVAAESLAQAEAARALSAESLARSRELAASAINVLDQDPELSVLLGLEAIVATPADAEQPVEALNALREGIHAIRLLERLVVSPGRGWVAIDGSEDGRWLATVSALEGTVSLLDTQTGQAVWTYDQPETVDSFFEVSISPDGTTVAVGVHDSARARPGLLPHASRPGSENDDGLPARVHLLDAHTGVVTATLSYPGCTEATPVPSFSPDGRLLAIGGLLGPTCDLTSGWELELVDLANLDQVERIPVGGDRFLSWTSDGATLAVGGDFALRTTLLDVATRQPRLELDSGGGVISPDGRYLALASGGFAMAFYDIESGATVDKVTGLKQLAAARQFTPDGAHLIIGTTGAEVLVVDVASGETLHRLGPDAYSTSFACIDGCRRMYSADDEIKLWDLSEQAAGEINSAQTNYWVNANSISTAGTRGAFLGFSLISSGYPEVVPFDGATGALHPARRFTDSNHPTVLPDGRIVVAEVADTSPEIGPVVAWNPETDEVEHIVGCWVTRISVQESGSGECADGVGEPFVLASAFSSPDNSSLLLESAHGDIRIFDSLTLEPTAETRVPDGHRFLAGYGGDWYLSSDGTIAHVVSLDGTFLATLGIGNPPVWAAVSPVGDILVAAELRGVVAVHATDTWQPLVSFDTEAIRGIALSPDGSKLLAAHIDDYVRVWDTRDGTELARIPIIAPSDGYWLDEHHIVVGTSQGLWTTLTLDLGELIDLGVSRITRGFTAEECDVYHVDPCPNLEDIRAR